MRHHPYGSRQTPVLRGAAYIPRMRSVKSFTTPETVASMTPTAKLTEQPKIPSQQPKISAFLVVGSQTFPQFNGKQARVLERCSDGKYRISIEGERGFFKVTKQFLDKCLKKSKAPVIDCQRSLNRHFPVFPSPLPASSNCRQYRRFHPELFQKAKPSPYISCLPAKMIGAKEPQPSKRLKLDTATSQKTERSEVIDTGIEELEQR
eukprot:TRINITY_DN4678_c0_g1_i1.p1 TRINITY_DN4678_c0_g1~~TRINITY_DN4678_c0_g1_i1.p1  ORF type:complete len:206 (-),score=19.23 TRINITY_DN4678_c0_g1_i1:109-726(-)